jgi:hypothetical protein
MSILYHSIVVSLFLRNNCCAVLIDMLTMVRKFEKLAVVNLQYDFRFSNPTEEV